MDSADYLEQGECGECGKKDFYFPHCLTKYFVEMKTNLLK